MHKNYKDLAIENQMLRQELKVAREAAEITARMVVDQFEQTEKMLRRYQAANAQRRAVLDAATRMSIIATDLRGNIILFNRGAENLLGYSSRDMVGRVNILYLHPAKELMQLQSSEMNHIQGPVPGMEIFERHLKKERIDIQEWHYVCADGALLPVNLSITPLFSAEGTKEGYLFTAMDLTLRKELEKKLVHAKVQAENASACRGDFLARMSHEIRTPMNAIMGMASLLNNTKLDFRQKDYVQKILDSSHILLSIINDILDFSKIDAGRMELETIPFSLQEVLNRLVNVVGIKAEEKGLKIGLHLDPDVPSNLVGDPLRLVQILMNLCINAIKFTHKGKVDVRIRVQELQQEHVTLFFSVRDTGIGLSPQQKAQLFEAFHQADSSITRNFGGSGLGLAICKELTQLMDGDIWVESNPGQGSDFMFTAVFRPLDESRDLQTGSDYIPGDIHGAKILVAEDNTLNQQVIQEFLREAGAWSRVVHNGVECLHELQQNHYDLVLMDIQMPEMDGLETARRIREMEEVRDEDLEKGREGEQEALGMEHGKEKEGEKDRGTTNRIPIIAMTAHTMHEDHKKSLQAGMDDHINKPVLPETLHQVLKQWLPKKVKDLSKPAIQARDTLPEEPAEKPFLPAMQGIDTDEALRRTNYNQELALELLQEFKKTYDPVPSILRQLQSTGSWRDIQDKAHAIKGASAYIGALNVHQTSKKLEKALKQGGFQNAGPLLQDFLQALEECLDSLNVLQPATCSAEMQQVHDPQQASEDELDIVTQKLHLLLQQLGRGELVDSRLLKEISVILRRNGFDQKVDKLNTLIDDIEHDAATQTVMEILEIMGKQTLQRHGH